MRPAKLGLVRILGIYDYFFFFTKYSNLNIKINLPSDGEDFELKVSLVPNVLQQCYLFKIYKTLNTF